MNVRDIQAASAPVFKRYGVVKASLFGSAARGEAGPDSDIDLLISLEKPIGLLKFSELAEQLEQALGRKVDLATHRSVNPHLAKRIANDLTSIYEG